MNRFVICWKKTVILMKQTCALYLWLLNADI